VVRQESNETGAIFFIYLLPIYQHHPLQSSSLGKPHTAGDIAPTPGSSVVSLHVEVPSAGLSRPFVFCPQFQNYDLWGGIWVLGKGRRHTDSNQASMVAAEQLIYIFWPKLLSRRWQCDSERCRDAASKCPQNLAGHDEPFFWVVQGPQESTIY